MGIKSFLHGLLFARHTVPATPIPEPKQFEQRLKAALLKCTTLTESEVDAYMAYEFEGIAYTEVPLDYQPEHPNERILCLYADGLLQTKILRRHTNQIAPETLAKVQQVLPELCGHYPLNDKF
jgi:hypothetical protein